MSFIAQPKPTITPISRQRPLANLPLVDMSRVATVILGGGMGTRLNPLTSNRCKPAISFGGRYRLVDVPVSNAINSGCNKIFVLTQFLSSSLNQHMFKTYQFDAFSPGCIELLPAEQKHNKKAGWFQGTADAVRQNLEYFMEVPTDYFLILSGDQLYHMDFQDMVLYAKENDADVVVATLPVSKKDTKRMGIMKIDSNKQITDFCEKPQTDEELVPLKALENKDKPYLASMGIYLFKRDVLIKLLKEDSRDDFGKHLIPKCVQQGGTYAYQFDGYWEDIGTIESFHEANIALTGPDPEFNCYDEKHPIFTAHSNLPGPKIRDTWVKHAIICEGSIVEGERIENSILGPRSVVRPGSVLKNTYVMGNDYYNYPIRSETIPDTLEIGEDCLIENAIIDKFVRIGNNVTLTNKDKVQHYDGEGVFIRDGIVVVSRGSSVPDGFTL